MFHNLKKWGYTGSSKKTPYQPPPSIRPPKLGAVKTAASYSYAEIIDLITDGPIQGPTDKNFIGVVGDNILQSIYFDSIPIAESGNDGNQGQSLIFDSNNGGPSAATTMKKTISLENFANGIVSIFSGGGQKSKGGCGSYTEMPNPTPMPIRNIENTWESREHTENTGTDEEIVIAEVYHSESKSTTSNGTAAKAMNNADFASVAFYNSAKSFTQADIDSALSKISNETKITQTADDKALSFSIADASKPEKKDPFHFLKKQEKKKKGEIIITYKESTATEINVRQKTFLGAAGIYGHLPKTETSESKYQNSLLKYIESDGNDIFRFTRKQLQDFIKNGGKFRFDIQGANTLSIAGGSGCKVGDPVEAISYLTPIFSKIEINDEGDTEEDIFAVSGFFGGIIWPFWWVRMPVSRADDKSNPIGMPDTIKTSIASSSQNIQIISNLVAIGENGLEEKNTDYQKYNFTNILCEFKKGTPTKENALANFKEVAILNKIGKELYGPFQRSGYVLRVLKRKDTISLGRGPNNGGEKAGSLDSRPVPGNSQKGTTQDFASWDDSSLQFSSEKEKPISFDILNKHTYRIEISLAINSLRDTAEKDYSNTGNNADHDVTKAGDAMPAVVDISIEYGIRNNTTGEKTDGNNSPAMIKKYRIVGLIESTTLVDIGNPELSKTMHTEAPGGVFMTGEGLQLPEEEIILPEPQEGHTRYVKITKTSYETNSVLISRSIAVDSITEIIPHEFSYPYSALMGLKIDSRSVSSIPKRGYLMRMKLVKIPSNYYPMKKVFEGNNEDASDQRYVNPTIDNYKPAIYSPNEWDGKFKTAWTDNPAWILYDLLTNKRYGLGEYISEENINKWALYKIGRYCDAVKEDGTFDGVSDLHGGLEPRFSCNIVFNEKFDAYEAINQISSLFNGVVYFWNSEIHVNGGQETDAIMMLTNSNVKGGEFVYASNRKDEQINSVEIVYQDRFDEYKKKIEYVNDEESIRKIGVYKKNISLLGVTSQAMARRAGKEIIYSSIYEQEHVSFVTGLEATLCRPGDIIEIADEMKSIQRNHGRILNYAKNIEQIAEKIEIDDSSFDPAKGFDYEEGTLTIDLTPEVNDEDDNGVAIRTFKICSIAITKINEENKIIPKFKAANADGNEIYLEFISDILDKNNIKHNGWVFYEIKDGKKYGTARIFGHDSYESPFHITDYGFKYEFDETNETGRVTNDMADEYFDTGTSYINEIQNGQALLLSNTFDENLFKKTLMTYKPKNRDKQGEYFEDKIKVATYYNTIKIFYKETEFATADLPTSSPTDGIDGIKDSYTAVLGSSYNPPELEKYGTLSYNIPLYTSSSGNWRIVWDTKYKGNSEDWVWSIESKNGEQWDKKYRSTKLSQEQIALIKSGKESPMSIMLDVMAVGYDQSDDSSATPYKWMKTDSDEDEGLSKIGFRNEEGGISSEEIQLVTNQIVRIDCEIAAKRENETGSIMIFENGKEEELEEIVPASPYKLIKKEGEDIKYKIISILEENINEYKIIAKQFNQSREKYIESTGTAQTSSPNKVYKFTSQQSDIEFTKLKKPDTTNLGFGSVYAQGEDGVNLTLTVQITSSEPNAKFHKITLVTPMGEKEIREIDYAPTVETEFKGLEEVGTYTVLVSTHGDRSRPSDQIKETIDYMGGASGMYNTEFASIIYQI